MIIEYPKSYNAYKHGTKDWTMPELEYLADIPFIWTEKIDGTNLRVIFDSAGDFEIRGRTDKAQLHPDLIRNVTAMFQNVEASNLIFFGEGYGAGIQKIGANYRPDKSFIGFDLYNTEKDFFYPFELTKELYGHHKIDFVPEFLPKYSIYEMMQFLAGEPKSYFGDFEPEGYVGQPLVPLYTQYGERIKIKMKVRDFK